MPDFRSRLHGSAGEDAVSPVRHLRRRAERPGCPENSGRWLRPHAVEDEVRANLLTLLPRLDFGKNYATEVDRGTHEACRLDVNRLLLERSGEFADGLVDLAGLPEFADCTDRRWFADGVHLTAEGYGIVAHFVAAAVRGLAGGRILHPSNHSIR